MNNMYEVNKNIDKLKNGKYTYFILPNFYKEISYKIKKDEYKIYKPYKDCDKFILYTSQIPKIKLFEIISYNKLRHQDILGSLFGLGINNEVFGDIILYDNKYYIYLIDEISNFVINNLTAIGNSKVTFKEVNINVLDNYERQYIECSTIVSSLRIDNVISKIIGTSRDKIKEKIKNKEILINYEILNNNSYNLNENDCFSIKRNGKYKFIGIIKSTKKDNYIIKYKKYI